MYVLLQYAFARSSHLHVDIWQKASLYLTDNCSVLYQANSGSLKCNQTGNRRASALIHCYKIKSCHHTICATGQDICSEDEVRAVPFLSDFMSLFLTKSMNNRLYRVVVIGKGKAVKFTVTTGFLS